MEEKYKGRVCSYIAYDNAVAHQIYAGSDLFLMPSKFEPCGISQMIALRYGTLPIVRETGGLRDTVQSYNEYEDTGNGFSFANYNAHEMLGAIRYALQTLQSPKRKRIDPKSDGIRYIFCKNLQRFILICIIVYYKFKRRMGILF